MSTNQEDFHPHIAIKDLKQRLLENKESIHTLLKMIIDYLQELPSSIEALLDERDLQKLNKFGHKLKGIALTASMPQLSEYGKSLQELESWDNEKITHLKEKISKEVNILLPLIKQLSNEF